MPTPAELRARLENEGEELRQITRKIENRIEDYKDWRGIVKRYPLPCVGVAVAAGILMSGGAASVPILALAYQQIRSKATQKAINYLKHEAEVYLS